MRRFLLLPLLAGLLGASLPAATVQFDATSLGLNMYRYTYTMSGFSFAQYQALEIDFDLSLYGALSNPTAGSGFDVVVFQPNDPPGLSLPGLYSAEAMVSNPSLLAPFTVDVTFLGTGAPGGQTFSLVQYDSAQHIVSSQSGVTTLSNGAATPEPASFALAGGGLLLGIMWRARRKAKTRAAA